MQEQKASRTPATERAYEKRAEQLLADCEREMGQSWRDDPLAACQHIAAKRVHVGKATWRQYRSALKFFMRRNGPVEAVAFLDMCGADVCKSPATNTSAKKARALSESDLVELLRDLANRKGRWDKILGLWLVAGSVTGLRPGEWATAELSPDGMILSVQNAKHTNGRGHGERRTLQLHDIPPGRRLAIKEFLQALAELAPGGSSFGRVYNSCRRRLTRVTRALWPTRKKHPSLYSPRHQVTADCKASGASLAEVAAILGHATDETASAHYGRRTAGEKTGGRVSVPAAEAERVRHKFRARPPFKPNPQKAGG